MGFEHNDIAIMGGLRAALEEETPMFERNDIVTVYKMNEAIAESGGGGGDLSTAAVTITATGDSGQVAVNTTYIAPDPGIGFDVISNAEVELDSAGSTSINVVLYKGHQALVIDNGTYVSSTGGITYNDEQGFYDVTGDCTITIALA